MTKGKLMRYSAFSTDPAGGNPAGVWIGESLPSTTDMQAIAKDVGYSETAFIAPMAGAKRTVRYFSPEIEVPFCGCEAAYAPNHSRRPAPRLICIEECSI